MPRRLCGPGIQRLQQARYPHRFIPLCLGFSLPGTFLTVESFSSFPAPVLHPSENQRCTGPSGTQPGAGTGQVSHNWCGRPVHCAAEKAEAHRGRVTGSKSHRNRELIWGPEASSQGFAQVRPMLSPGTQHKGLCSHLEAEVLEGRNCV